MNKYVIYPYLFPFRSRRQKWLREQRRDITFEVFSQRIERGPRHDEITRCIWNCLRDEQAFVEDFKPDPKENLAEVYAMGPEEVRDDLVDPITDRLGLDLSRYDFKGFDFRSLKTPSDVARFLMSLADEKNEASGAPRSSI